MATDWLARGADRHGVRGSAGSAPAGEFHGVVSQGHLTDADYNRMRSGNVGTLRVNVRWSTVQPNKDTPRGAWNWAPFDAIFANAAQRGVRIQPALDAPSPKGIPDPPVNRPGRRAFVDFAGAVVRRYGRGGSFWSGRRARPAKAYQIYNEQNGPAYWRARPNLGNREAPPQRVAGDQPRGPASRDRPLGGMFSYPQRPRRDEQLDLPREALRGRRRSSAPSTRSPSTRTRTACAGSSIRSARSEM